MKLQRRGFLHLAAGAVAMSGLPRLALALDYPTRPVRIVVPYPAGIAPDIVARLVAQALSQRLKQQFVVDNRPTCTSDCCPAGWNTFKPTATIPGSSGCWRNSDPKHSVQLPIVTLTATNLKNLEVGGRAFPADTDTITVSNGDLPGNVFIATAPTVLNLANNWQVAEFNIFGDGK